MSIATFAEVLVELQKTGDLNSSELGLANAIHLAAERAVKGELGYNVEQQTWTEYYPVRDRGLWEHGVVRQGRILHVRQRPIRSITSIFEDTDAYSEQASSAFASSDELTEGTDFTWILDHDADGDYTNDASLSGKILRVGSEWPVVPGSIRVIYSAGWAQDEIPHDIRRAVVVTVSDWWSMVNSAGGSGRIVQSERLGDYSVSFVTDRSSMEMVLPVQASLLLTEWRRARAA